jgi:hypothetical protein
MTSNTSEAGVADAAQDWHSDVFGILPEPDAARVWLVPVEGGWALPYAEVDEFVYLNNVGRLSELMSRQLQIDVVTYRATSFHYDEAARTCSGVYVLDYRAAPQSPPSGAGRWVDRQSLTTLNILPGEHRAVLEAYLAEVESGHVPPQRPPWARRGWFHQAESWIQSQVAALGYVSLGPVEQVRCWSISCVLRLPTDKHMIYFKTAADLPLFVDEPTLLEGLSAWYPDHIPRPLVVDQARQWMLLTDWGQPLGWEVSPENLAAIYRTMAQIQVASAGRVEDLLRMGCADRRLHLLATQIDPLLEDGLIRAMLDDAEQARLHRLAPRLKAMCAELASYNLPHALVHGDLHPGNAALHNGKVLIFDWTDGCVSHPFFDLMHLLQQPPELREQLRDSYLEAWLSFEPPERLQEAWDLALPLCALHHTISYQHIVANLEPASHAELASGLAFFGRQVLELMPA